MGSHSNELERRVTTLEVTQVERASRNEDWKDAQHDVMKAVQARMALHEKAILGICGALQILMQDKWPSIAAALKGLLR